MKTSFSFLLTKIGFLLFIYFTNSRIPPSYLCKNSFCFFEVLSTSLIAIPLFKNASSLILFSSVAELNLIDEKISFDGVFMAIHGTPGEDGILQAYFDLLKIPYNCCGSFEAAITFNKAMCNALLKQFHSYD